jgi:23S rRNA (adenine2503-C2)-methyltransferase
MKDLVYDLSYMQLSSLVDGWGHPGYRSTQVWQGLYKKLWTTPQEFTNLPISLREGLDQALEFHPLTPIVTQTSSDGQTTKTMFRLQDGNSIETVLMMYDHTETLGPQKGGDNQHARRTLCISTQVGCAMGCVFCATGQMGFKRNLSQGEIIGQVMYFARKLKDDGDLLTNIVLMGMGEPFHNYDQTMAAIDQMNDPSGFNFGARRFTISTVGLLPAIKRFN